MRRRRPGATRAQSHPLHFQNTPVSSIAPFVSRCGTIQIKSKITPTPATTHCTLLGSGCVVLCFIVRTKGKLPRLSDILVWSLTRPLPQLSRSSQAPNSGMLGTKFGELRLTTVKQQLAAAAVLVLCPPAGVKRSSIVCWQYSTPHWRDSHVHFYPFFRQASILFQ